MRRAHQDGVSQNSRISIALNAKQNSRIAEYIGKNSNQ
jgi:hypothetical protein